MKKLFTSDKTKYIQKVFAHKIALLGFTFILLLIDFAAICYVESNPISVYHKTLLPLAAVAILYFFIFLFYIFKADILKKCMVVVCATLLPIADFFWWKQCWII